SLGKLAGSVALLPLLIVIASSPLPSTTRSPDFSTDTSVPAAALATALAMRSSGDLPQAASAATRRTRTTYVTVRILVLRTIRGWWGNTERGGPSGHP